MSQPTFDLRLATLAEAYRRGELTPRALLADIRQKAQTLNPEYQLFIHILTAEEQEPGWRRWIRLRRRRYRCTACRLPSKIISILRELPPPPPVRPSPAPRLRMPLSWPS